MIESIRQIINSGLQQIESTVDKETQSKMEFVDIHLDKNGNYIFYFQYGWYPDSGMYFTVDQKGNMIENNDEELY